MTEQPRPRRRRRFRLIVALVFLGLLAGWFGYRALTWAPAGTPQAVELAEARISDRLASATVLAVGEATHGTHEFRAAWQTVAVQLAGRGFTTLAFEENSGSVSAVNDWVQGGPGTAEDAVRRFGFRLSRTQEMVDLITWARQFNQGRPEPERVRLYGIDVQRPEADRQVALGWLAGVDPDAARTLGVPLAGLTDATPYDRTASRTLLPHAENLLHAVEQAAASSVDDGTTRAVLSARALVHGLRLGAASKDGTLRDELMAEQLAWLVDQRARQDSAHTLLFAHNGHVDRVGAANAAQSTTLGTLAVKRWGDRYRVIGTDSHHTVTLADDVTSQFTVPSPVRGLFTGTQVGYLELADATPDNSAVLQGRWPMPSAGWPFLEWQALIPFLHEVQVVPADSWDALIYAHQSTPVTPIP